jgi:SAM-dependent methyltransferase
MAREITRDFVLEALARLELPDPIVEFGSLQVEPEQDSDLRGLLRDQGRGLALGTDYRPGPGVDRVEDLRALGFADGELGTAICLDTLEHCADPWTAVREMHRVVHPDGGACLISSVMRFPIHGYPDDYFRFTPSGFAALLEPFENVWTCGVGDPAFPQEVFGIGVRGPALPPQDLLAEGRLWFHQQVHERGPWLRVGQAAHRPRDLVRAVVADLPRYVRVRRSQRGS